MNKKQKQTDLVAYNVEFDEVDEMPDLLVMEEIVTEPPVDVLINPHMFNTASGRKQILKDQNELIKRQKIYIEHVKLEEREENLTAVQWEHRKTYMPIAMRVLAKLKEHDAAECETFHQAMVTVSDVLEAIYFSKVYNQLEDGGMANEYHSNMVNQGGVLKEFHSGDIQVLVVINALPQTIHHTKVSVVGIARPRISADDFEQFVGRAVRLTKDPIACVISHARFGMLDMVRALKPIIAEKEVV